MNKSLHTSLFILSILITGCFITLLIGSTQAQVLGVDLSAENIKVAAVRSGNPFHIVIDEQAKRKVPLAIAFDDGQRHFGNNAIGFALRKPLDTYLYAQRLLGQTMTSNRLTQLRDSFAYDYVPIPGRGSAVGIKAIDGTIYSPEELVAMSLEHVLKIAYDDGNVGVKDVVITVPHWFGAIEKESLIQAAELAGMSVMSLITDTAASSIQYGLDRTFDNTNTTQHVCIIDIGASGTEMSYIQYQGVKQRSGQVKIAGHANVIASHSDETVGGHFVDKVIRDHFLDLVAQQIVNKPRKDGLTVEDIKKQPRAMAKLLKQAQGVKHILSANQEAKIHIESVWKDIDLSGSIRRNKFEELIAPQVTALDVAIQKFLKMLPANFTQFDDIVIVGGTSRIPLFQNVLKQSFRVERLGQTLNGDEAMVMGAVFMAANQSIAFQVRPMLMTDANNGDVHVHIHDESLTINTKYTEIDAEDESTKVAGKHVILFPKHSPVNKRKTLTLTAKTDMLVSVNYDTNDVCVGCHAAVKGYSVAGITSLYEEYIKNEVVKHVREAELGLSRVPVNATMTEEDRESAITQSRLPPKGLRVSLTFTTAETTIPRLLAAEVLLDDWTVIDDTPKVSKKKAKKPLNKKKEEKSADDQEQQQDIKDDETSEALQQQTKDEPDIEPEAPKQIWRLEKRIKRTPLTLTVLPLTLDTEIPPNIIKVTSSGVMVNGFIPMSAQDMVESKAKMAALTNADNARRQLAAQRNALESLIYQVKSDIEDEPMSIVTNEVQREECMAKAVELSEWLDDVGDDFSSNDGSIQWYDDRRDLIKTKTDELQALLKPVLYRAGEYKERENTWNSLQGAFVMFTNSTTTFRTSKPWIVEQLDVIDEQVKVLQVELNELYKEQEGRDQALDPVWVNSSAVAKFTALTDALKKAARTPKPKSIKVEEEVKEEEEVREGETTTEGEQEQQQEQQQSSSQDDQQTQQDQANNDTQQQEQQQEQQQQQEPTKKPTHDEL